MPICQQCTNEYETKTQTNDGSRFCSNKCRQAAYRTRNGIGSYTAQSIKVMKDYEILESFSWVQALALAEQYKRDAGWIMRAAEACKQVGAPISYFIDRYLMGAVGEPNPLIPKREDVDAAFRELHRNRN